MASEIGPGFIEETKYHRMEMTGEEKRTTKPKLQYKFNATNPFIDLPSPENLGPVNDSLKKAIENRGSIRRYSPQSVSLKELAYLLWCTQGIKRVVRDVATFRNVPSAGARHAFETLLLVNRITELSQGLYQYMAAEHKLLNLDNDPELTDKAAEACLGQKHVLESAVTFLWVAVVDRMTWRYGQRGYRYLFLDAGHVCQNLYLSAESIGCGVCAIAAFSDDDINALLRLDGTNQFVLYIATAGKKLNS